jgi:hypothetical protein
MGAWVHGEPGDGMIEKEFKQVYNSPQKGKKHA